VLAKANLFTARNELIEEQAKSFVNSGIKPLDALHLASAVSAQADYFCTCDDRFLRRAKEAETGLVKVVSPLELVTEISI
jgi:predicted nucleic acid-binding protein